MKGLGAGIVIIIMIAIGAIGFIAMSDYYQSSYINAYNNTINQTNSSMPSSIDNSSYNLATGLTDPIDKNIAWIVLFGFLLVVIMIFIIITKGGLFED